MEPFRAVPGKPPIFQYWHTRPAPDEVEALTSTFRDHNGELPHLLVDEVRAEQFIAEHLTEREAAAFRACAVPSMQADYFRYCATYAFGGIYADADLRCVGSVDPLIANEAEGILFGRKGDPLEVFYGWPYELGPYGAVGSNLFAFRVPRHPFLALALELATSQIEDRRVDGPRGVWLIGPGVFTTIYFLHRLGSLDAFLEYSADTVLAPVGALLQEIAAEPRMIARAMESVEILPPEAIRAWVCPVPAAGFKGRVEWRTVKGSIFR